MTLQWNKNTSRHKVHNLKHTRYIDYLLTHDITDSFMRYMHYVYDFTVITCLTTYSCIENIHPLSVRYRHPAYATVLL